MTRKLIVLIFLLINNFVISQRPNRTIYDNEFNVNDLIAMPYINYCLGRGCPDGISLESYDSIAKVATFIKQHSSFIFQIESHTDQRGNEKQNQVFSYNRAVFFQQTLVRKNGVDSTIIFTKGFGESNPIYSQKQIDKLKTKEEKESLYMQNRRTVLRILRKK